MLCKYSFKWLLSLVKVSLELGLLHLEHILVPEIFLACGAETDLNLSRSGTGWAGDNSTIAQPPHEH